MYNFDEIIGTSMAMQRIFSLLEIVINSNCTIMIEGESGVGKEVISRAIHYNSPRKDKPLVIQNCSGLNENLLESELFGHVRGSFTGAVRDKKGLFEVADKGSFFLDEIAEMSPALQVKLLRVLQEGTFTKVGATQPQKVDVRIIASTNKKLEELVEQGKFREDLYYRLNVIKVDIPPLRERKEDIPLLIDSFLDRFAKANGRRKKSISEAAQKILLAYNWPGNVRELEKEVEKLVLMSNHSDLITEDLLSPRIKESKCVSRTERVKKEGKLRDAITALEKEMISEALVKNNWNKTKTARDLGMSRVCIIGKIYAYNLGRYKNGLEAGRERKVNSDSPLRLNSKGMMCLYLMHIMGGLLNSELFNLCLC
jgi:two-component system response regulator HupR/HoxA